MVPFSVSLAVLFLGVGFVSVCVSQKNNEYCWSASEKQSDSWKELAALEYL